MTVSVFEFRMGRASTGFRIQNEEIFTYVESETERGKHTESSLIGWDAGESFSRYGQFMIPFATSVIVLCRACAVSPVG